MISCGDNAELFHIFLLVKSAKMLSGKISGQHDA